MTGAKPLCEKTLHGLQENMATIKQMEEVCEYDQDRLEEWPGLIIKNLR